METLQQFITESMAGASVQPVKVDKFDAKFENQAYVGAMGFIKGSGLFGGVIIGKPFTMDDNATRNQSKSLAERDFTIVVDFEDLIKDIETNKNNVYDYVLQRNKYKNMSYVYFLSNAKNQVYCCLYSDFVAAFKGNYAFAFLKA